MDLKSIGAVPVLPFQSGVCGLCHYWAPLGRMYCDSCISACAMYGFEVNPNKPMVRTQISDKPKAAVGLQMFLRANANSLSYKYGWQYKSKDADVSQSERQQAQSFIGALLEFGLSHESCLAKQLQLSEETFDVVAWVPSKSTSKQEHQLGTMLRSSSAKSRVRSLLTFKSQTHVSFFGTDRAKHNWSVSENDRPMPNSVLLVDDMWTSGQTMISAAAALFDAGVNRIGMLSLGRHVNRYGNYYSPDGIYESLARRSDLDIKFCANCDSRADVRPSVSLGDQYGESAIEHKVEVLLQTVKAGPDWNSTWSSSGSEAIGMEVWCREFKYGIVVAFFPEDDSVKIDFGVFRRRRFLINDSLLKWKPLTK